VKVKSLSLSWFRGVGSQLTLVPDGRSVVVYGPNGSGKSTFPDALEYLVSRGKIGHLAHEYSGSRLERAVRNTHAPAAEPAVIELEMADGERVRVEISASGKAAFNSSSSKELLETLNAVGLERLILRQDEVSRFIHATKGQKYSALLPLLGLEDLELAAHNLNALRLAVSKLGELEEKRGRLEELETQARQVWPELSRDGVTEALGELASRHGQKSEDAAGSVESLEAAIDSRIAAIEDERRRFRRADAHR
jgi:chromosome segregation ATPase